ncbi:MAG: response regulator [Candidatus Omnitrophica bacterium]|nr:response regulator [Candidatus Omnitrophota bacterium]
MASEKLPPKNSGEMSSEKEQIFIVDDDESVCRALGVLLATYGFSVKAFTCAEEFFRAVPNSVPGCLLLDIHMPGLDGWETLEHLLASGSCRPVIILSADKDEGFNERAVKAGAVGYLQKPFNDQALVELIRVAIGKKKYK